MNTLRVGAPRLGRRRSAVATVVTVAAAFAAAAAATASAAAAAVASPPPAGWRADMAGSVVATVAATAAAPWAAAGPPAGTLPAVATRPLASGVSVYTDTPYKPVDEGHPGNGSCPLSLLIASPLGGGNGTFAIPPAHLTVDGVGCSGAAAGTALRGTYGENLEAAAALEGMADTVAEILRVDPEMALAAVDGGPLTCGNATYGGASVFLFAVIDTIPVVVLMENSNVTSSCGLAILSTSQTP